MYEMYPDAWTVTGDRQHADGEKPRRRARKEHSVVPAVLTHQTDPAVRGPRLSS